MLEEYYLLVRQENFNYGLLSLEHFCIDSCMKFKSVFIAGTKRNQLAKRSLDCCCFRMFSCKTSSEFENLISWLKKK